ncbi:iron permease [Mycena olivaceomarginata]|nr:iron permease [Mycena olivaceomarginata]
MSSVPTLTTLTTLSMAASSTDTVVSASPSLPKTVVSSTSDSENSPSTSDPPSSRKGSAFWLSYAAVCICTFVSALDVTSIPTALPSIIDSLSGSAASAWVGSSYTLASSALAPLTGNLANIFGRRPVMLGSILLFALGSALAGTAQSMEWLIVARTLQGMGGGGMNGLSSIIVADIVPLAERGAYQGFEKMMWASASGIGPILGGVLSEKVSWRWLFYINLPASAFAFVFVLFFLRVHTPSGNVWSKLTIVDWFGNFLLIIGTILTNISLTWAGVHYAWIDIRVLAPLISGLALMVAFVIYEKYIPTMPTMHWDVVSNRTALASLVATFFSGITSISILYFLPLFFQAVFLASPVKSAIYSIPSAFLISPFSLLNGLVILKAKRYLQSVYIGWMVIIVGFGLLSMLGPDSSLALRVISQIVAAAGTGIVISSLPFALMAPIPVELLGSAIAFNAFLRTLSQTLGITISAAILQNTVKRKFPARFIEQLPAGDFAFAALGRIAGLPQPMQDEVKAAFGDGISAIYQVMIGVAGLGLLCVLFMKEVPMRRDVDSKFALKEKRRGGDGDVEKGQGLLQTHA